MSQTSDFGVDQTLQATRSQELEVRVGIMLAGAPISYEVAYYLNGKPSVVSFECHASERIGVMRRSLGISLDNDAWVLRTQKSDGSWSTPIGSPDPELRREFNPRR